MNEWNRLKYCCVILLVIFPSLTGLFAISGYLATSVSDLSPRVQAFHKQVRDFIRENIAPIEKELDKHYMSNERWTPHPKIEELKVWMVVNITYNDQDFKTMPIWRIKQNKLDSGTSSFLKKQTKKVYMVLAWLTWSIHSCVKRWANVCMLPRYDGNVLGFYFLILLENVNQWPTM